MLFFVHKKNKIFWHKTWISGFSILQALNESGVLTDMLTNKD